MDEFELKCHFFHSDLVPFFKEIQQNLLNVIFKYEAQNEINMNK